MPTDRLFKFTVPGLMFLLSVVMFDYVFGGTLLFTQYELLSLLGIFFSTPIIGVIVGTFLFGFLKARYGHEVHFYVPSDPELIQWILKSNKQLLKKIIVDGEIDLANNEENKKDIYPYYQVKVRKCIKGEELQFLERRWSIYWTHSNNIFAIVLALIYVVSNELTNIISSSPDLTVKKAIIIGVACVYVRLAWLEIKRTKAVANKVEHLLLEEAMKMEKRLA